MNKKIILPDSPNTWDNYRIGFASILKSINAPDDLVQVVSYLDLEGGGLVSSLWSGWLEIESEYIAEWSEIAEQLGEVAWELARAYNNSWNYAPNSSPKKIDADKLQIDVENFAFNL